MKLSATPPPGIGLFDMDGTLLAWDCQLLFRHHVIKAEPFRWLSVPLFLLFLPFASLIGTEGMKRVFHSFLWRMPPATLKELSQSFAAKLQKSFYPEIVEKVETHNKNGDLTILSSASPECYASEVGKLLGFDLALGTVLENTSLFPDLTNHKGYEKVTRLRKILPPSYFENDQLRNAHAYTDSVADLPMTTICQKTTLVNPSESMTDLGKRSAWEIIRPNRPWSSPKEKAWRILMLLFAIGDNPAKL